MMKRELGNSGIFISAAGFGAGQTGGSRLTEKETDILLNSVIDCGINLIDTAKSYGNSEELIGRFLSHRRSDFVISTKIGYGIPGYPDWTYDIIAPAVDEALRIMRTDYIDIVHFHSCPKETLIHSGIIDALSKVVEAGKVKVMAYSGENEDLYYAVSTGRFGSVQTSINICDQRDINNLLPLTKEKKMGVIAKRPIANAPWRFNERPIGDYAEEYWLRWKKMNLETGIPPSELFVRFTAHTEGVTSCIFGSGDIDHIRQNVELVGKGPLPPDIYSYIRKAFVDNDDNWTGQL